MGIKKHPESITKAEAERKLDYWQKVVSVLEVSASDSHLVAQCIERSMGKHSLSIMYRDKKSVITERVVTALALIGATHEDVDYSVLHRPPTVVVWCHLRNDLRILWLPSMFFVTPVFKREINMAKLVRAVARIEGSTRKRLRNMTF